MFESESIMQSRVLVVDDEPAVRRALERALELEGYVVEQASDGEEALSCIKHSIPDVVILDVLMPNLSGLELCRRLRSLHISLPVLMLTARDAVSDRVEGLDAGADDYLVKPFALAELLARVRALLRRGEYDLDESIIEVGDLVMNLGTREVIRAGRLIDLTRTEFNLLELFMRNPRQVLTRSQIFDRIWGYDFGSSSNSLDVYIGYLRRKTEADGDSRVIQTVRGVGYALREV